MKIKPSSFNAKIEAEEIHIIAIKGIVEAIILVQGGEDLLHHNTVVVHILEALQVYPLGEQDLSMTTFIEWSTLNHYAESTPSLPITASSIFPCSIPPSSTLEMPLAQVNTSANANSSEPRPLVEESSMEAHVLEPNPPSLSPLVQSNSTGLDVSSSSMR
nr:hypothetical protein CFP56_61031 [Quercus suber]